MTEEKCQCKEMSCVYPCDRKHTCHTYWCEKCRPEDYTVEDATRDINDKIDEFDKRFGHFEQRYGNYDKEKVGGVRPIRDFLRQALQEQMDKPEYTEEYELKALTIPRDEGYKKGIDKAISLARDGGTPVEIVWRLREYRNSLEK